MTDITKKEPIPNSKYSKAGKEGVYREEHATVDNRRVRLLVAPPKMDDRDPDLQLPVLFLHGLGCTGDVWIPTLKEMQGRGLCCPALAPDLPGFGRSIGPSEAMSMDELGDWVVQFLDVRNIGKAHLVGNSMGCQVALAVARRHPERVGALVLQGPTTGERAVPKWRYVGGLAVDAFQETWRYNAKLAVMYFQAGPRRYFQTVHHMMNDDPIGLAKEVTEPVLVIRGGRDAIVSDLVARKLAAALPNAVYTPLDSAAHAIEYNNPREFTDSMMTFLTRAEEKLEIPVDAKCAIPASDSPKVGPEKISAPV